MTAFSCSVFHRDIGLLELGSSDDEAGVVRDSSGLINALWMVCFLWGHMSSRSAFRGTWGCTIKRLQG
jgi:hypothetical protein